MVTKFSPQIFGVGSNPLLADPPDRLFTIELSHVLEPCMERDGQASDDKCLNGRCWYGPNLVIETTNGTIGNLRVALKVFLGKFYGKEVADRMVSTLVLGHFEEEDTIMACAIGREPAGAVLREICALINVYANGTLTTPSTSYTFKLTASETAYTDLVLHYQWLRTLGKQPPPQVEVRPTDLVSRGG